MLLSVQSLEVSIGPVEILRGVSFEVGEREMDALAGRNGAGKTTTMRAIMGLIPVKSGKIQFRGKDLGALSAHRRAALGIGYMPEDRRLVPQLTIEENILLPVWAMKRLDRAERLARAYDLLPELVAMRHRKPQLLSGGQQKLVALARAAAAGTDLLLLDEPFEGVAPALSQRLAEVIRSLRNDRLSVLIAQSDSNHSSKLIGRKFVIERGRTAPALAPG